MKYLKLILTFAIFTNLFLVDVHSVTHEKFKKQLKNTKDKINKLNKNVPKSNPSKSKDVNIKNKTTSKTNPTCRKGKNFIFFGKTDNYIRVVGPDKFRNEYNEVKDPKKVFSNFSFLSQQPNKNYFVEYVFDPNGTVTATNMTTCKSMKYNWAFKGSSVKTAYKVYLSQANRNDIEMAIYLGGSRSYKNKIRFHTKGQYTNCYNYQNPQCNQPIAETLLVGFRDLKSNKSYVQLKDAYLVKAAELKKKKEEERLAAQKKREAEIKARQEEARLQQERREKREKKNREEAAKKKSIFKFTRRNFRVWLSKLYGYQGFL